jgi:tRNA G10  N-methylase Trm11
MGTGSMAYVSVDGRLRKGHAVYIFIKPVSHFGALIFGSDIDGRQMRGKGAELQFLHPGYHSILSISGKPVGVLRAAAQYGVASRVLDLCTFDVTRNPWRCGELFDAIITDPPCETVSVHVYPMI